MEVTLQEAGTLSTLITDEQKANLKSLKITGDLNGTDLKYIREQLKSTLTTLDMADANIVEGGEAYYSDKVNGTYYTQKDKITDRTFASMSCLATIKLPNSLLSIEGNVFESTPYLANVVLGDKLESVGENAFRAKEQLRSINIPITVKKIGDRAFYGCIHLPNNIFDNTQIEEIGYAAFESCREFVNINLPNTLVTIGGEAFYGCYDMQTINLGNSVKTIGNGAFNGCTALSGITLPKTLESIGGSAFYNCQRIKSLAIPNSVTSIGIRAFEAVKQVGKFVLPSSLLETSTSIFANVENQVSHTIIFCGKTNIVDVAGYSTTWPQAWNIQVPQKYLDDYKGMEALSTNTILPITDFDLKVSVSSSLKYGTICIPQTGGYVEGIDKLYVIDQLKGSSLKLKEVEPINDVYNLEAGAPYIYQKSEEATEIKVCYLSDAAVEPDESSYLKGTFTDIYAPKGSYVLQSDGKFHVVAEDGKIKVAANKAYLSLPVASNSKAFNMVFSDDEITGIQEIGKPKNTDSVHIYDLSGRCISKPSKGVYIQNGKKYIVK